MLAYLEKHPEAKDIQVWRPMLYNGSLDMSTWCCVQDRFGKIIVGERTPFKIGADYDFGPFIISWNSKKGASIFQQRAINILGRVISQVSMKEAQELAGVRLPHLPYCYEVVCD